MSSTELVKSFIIGHILGQSPWQISAIFSCLVPSVFYCLGLAKQSPAALRDPRKTCQTSFLKVSAFTYRNMRRNYVFLICVISVRPRVDKNIGRGVREKWAEILTLPLTSRGYFREVTQPFQVSVSSFGKWEQYPSHGVIRRLKEKSVCKAHGSVVVPSTPSKPRSIISSFTGLPSKCVPITRL